MNFTKKQLQIGAMAAVLVIIIVAFVTLRPAPPLPDNTLYKGNATFSYPRALELEEYTARATAVGTTTETGEFIPLIHVVEYRSDPDVALPANFEAFARRQAVALCGSDGTESITCSSPVIEPYTTAGNHVGSRIDLTLTRRNLTSGTTTTATYGPIYVFDTSSEPEEDEARRFEGVFVYPGLSAAIQGIPTDDLLRLIMDTLVIDDLLPETTEESAAEATPEPAI